jgi:hypothetical protein
MVLVELVDFYHGMLLFFLSFCRFVSLDGANVGKPSGNELVSGEIRKF